MRRGSTHDRHESMLGAWAPMALLVMDSSGAMIFRNQAALDLPARVTAERGSAVVSALRAELSGMVTRNRTFPVTKMVSAECNGTHAYAEMTVDRLGDTFVGTWADVTDREDARRFLTEMATDIDRSAATLAALGEQLAADTGDVSARTEAVASGATQMSASIGEISRNTTQAATHTAAAVSAAQGVADRINELVNSSAKIEAVNQLITTIARQTNLLALNATIEAARAGDAGKGFAVVAGEVKDLANETARATSDIAPMIANIQSSSHAVGQAIVEIVSLIGQIEAEQATIASAVEQQSAASEEMSGSITAVATSTQSVSQAVSRLRETSHDVAAKARQLTARS